MELDDLKYSWQQHLERTLQGKPASDIHHLLTMKISNTLTRLNEKNLYWWKFTRTTMIILFATLVLNISFFIIFPDKFQNLQNALPVFGIMAVYALAILLVYYEKVKIFDIADAANIRSAIEKSIRRFNRWYVMSNMVYALFLPLMFYVVVNLGAEAFLHRTFELKTEVMACIILTVLTLLGNHWYYQRTYFHALADLKGHLRELSEEG